MKGPQLLELGLDVVIPRIMELGMQEAPKEACGIVIPDLEVPPDQWIHSLVNRSPAPENSYAIDPETIRQLVSDLQGKHLWADVLIWHTHPRGNVGPSQGDIEAKVQGLNYLVVSLPTGEATKF